jgi:agmatinase
MKVVNFGDLEEEYTQYSKSQIVILPVSFDKTSTWLKGSERGPRAIIDASRNLELYDIDTGTEVYRNGIYTAKTRKLGSSEQSGPRSCSELYSGR